MYKIAAIIGGVLLMAGVALAGTVSSLGSTGGPTIGQTIPIASTTTTTATTTTATTRQDDRRGREAEARGRANEPGEDVRHEDRGREAEPGDDRGREIEPGDDRGRNRGGESHGRHHGGDDRGGESGHGGHGGDD
jgi:hypothetical protein